MTNKIGINRLVLENQEKVNEDLICPICKHILQEPQACDNCVKVFCKHCIQEKIDLYKACICGGSAEGVSKAPKVINQMLKKKQFYCIFHQYGCDEKISYSEINLHENECQYKQIECPNQGCEKKFTKQDLESHLNDCEYQLKQCKYCDKYFASIHLEEHEQNCDESIKKCDGCQKEMKKKELLVHHNICEKVELQCFHCEKTFLRPKFDKHSSLNCLKDLIAQFEEEYISKVKMYQEMINGYLDKLKENQQHLKLFCKKCRKFSCKEVLTKCFLCKQFVCTQCSKKELKNCSQCKDQFCEQCMDYATSNSNCFFCESNDLIQSSTTKSYYCRRTDCLKNYDMEKKIIKYNENNQNIQITFYQPKYYYTYLINNKQFQFKVYNINNEFVSAKSQ